MFFVADVAVFYENLQNVLGRLTVFGTKVISTVLLFPVVILVF